MPNIISVPEKHEREEGPLLSMVGPCASTLRSGLQYVTYTQSFVIQSTALFFFSRTVTDILRSKILRVLVSLPRELQCSSNVQSAQMIRD